ncbi:hypothetical protein BDZ45DRAFT_678201 [Acephala macrosclerotiorum]|nr:hypothetical protein BDZ45DRAFT_678201 [Acephala macrosclerotiorum]
MKAILLLTEWLLIPHSTEAYFPGGSNHQLQATVSEEAGENGSIHSSMTRLKKINSVFCMIATTEASTEEMQRSVSPAGIPFMAEENPSTWELVRNDSPIVAWLGCCKDLHLRDDDLSSAKESGLPLSPTKL